MFPRLAWSICLLACLRLIGGPPSKQCIDEDLSWYMTRYSRPARFSTHLACLVHSYWYQSFSWWCNNKTELVLTVPVSGSFDWCFRSNPQHTVGRRCEWKLSGSYFSRAWETQVKANRIRLEKISTGSSITERWANQMSKSWWVVPKERGGLGRACHFNSFKSSVKPTFSGFLSR